MRLLINLLFSFIAVGNVWAQLPESSLESITINNAVLLDGSIIVKWQNDSVYPWTIDGSQLKNGNTNIANSKSKIAFSYKSDTTTQVSFKVNMSYYSASYHNAEVCIDGVNAYKITSTGDQTISCRLPSGEHVISLEDIAGSKNNGYTTCLKDVNVVPVLPLTMEAIDTAVVLPGSLPVEWTDHSKDIHPWTISDGKLKSGNVGYDASSSAISFTYTSEYPTELTFDCYNNSRYYNYSSSNYVYHNESRIYIDGKEDLKLSSSGTWSRHYRLPPGTHTVMLKDSIDANSDYQDLFYQSKLAGLYTTLDNVKVVELYPASKEAIDTAVVLPGSLPVEWTDHSKDIHPWTISDGKLKSGNVGYDASSSAISFTYTSEYPTELTFDCYNNSRYYNYSSSNYVYHNESRIYIDGKQDLVLSSSGTWSRHYRLPPGTHTVMLKDSIDANSDYQDLFYQSKLAGLYTTLDNVKVVELYPASKEAIDTAVVLPGSLPVEWTDHSKDIHPWTISDGKLKSGNVGYDASSSAISFTYTSEYPTELTFDCYNNSRYYNYSSSNYVYHNESRIYIDGKQDLVLSSGPTTWSRHYRLPPGTHTVMLKDSIDANSDYQDLFYQSKLAGLYTTLDNVKVVELYPASKEAIDTAVVLPGSLPVEWTDHSKDIHPWTISDGKLKSGNVGYDASSSVISFTYTSEYPTELTFDCYNNSRYYNPSDSYYDVYHDDSRLYIDGKEDLVLSSGPTTWSRVYYMPAGTHTVMLKDSIDANSNYQDLFYQSKLAGLYTTLDNVKVFEMPHLDSALLTKNSLPMEFFNESEHVWKTTDGYAKSTNATVSGSESVFYSTITVDKPSLLSFEWLVGKDYSSHYTQFIINDKVFAKNSANTSWTYQSVVLPAGTYTVKWRDYTSSANNAYYSQVRNISLTQDWVEVNTVAGMLGIEVLYKVDRLKDVKLLKVNGTLNSDDWEHIKLMTNLQGIDLSGTQITSIGQEAFKSNPYLSYVVLPEGLKTISSSAFNGTQLYSMVIPASVTEIGSYAFKNQKLNKLEFRDGSSLAKIGYQAFRNCDYLTEVVLPDGVTTIGEQAFRDCDGLKKIHFPDSLEVIPAFTCYHNNILEFVHFPKNLKQIGQGAFFSNRIDEITLPDGVTDIKQGAFKDCRITHVDFSKELMTVGDSAFYGCNVKDIDFHKNLKSIGSYAFYDCNAQSVNLPDNLESIGSYAFKECNLDSLVLPLRVKSLGADAFGSNDSLVYVSLPSISSFGSVFKGCPMIKTVVCPVATPPAISSDPFPNCNKADATLIVPDFAIAPYKLDDYWYNFGKIIEGVDIDYWRIQSDLRLLNNRRMDGKPDIDLYYGGALTIGGDAPMSVGVLNIYESEANPSRLVNESPELVVDEINLMFSVSANKWHYITPMVDVDLREVGHSSTTNYVFRYYDGATRAEIGAGTSWKNVSDLVLKAGTGYIFQCNTAGVLSFPVKAEQHNQLLMKNAVTLPLTAHPSDNSANKGWNYLGNPYPCYYDIYYMDFTAPITVWTGSTYKAYSITDDNFVLRPMQGFFVQKPDEIDRIVMQPAGCQIESTSKRTAALASSRSRSNVERNIFNIEISVDTLVDMTRVVLNENAASYYEMECDAAKFMSTEEYMPQIFTIDAEGNYLAINERPSDDCVVALGLYIPDSERVYTLSASKADKDIYLFDNAIGKVVANLAEEAYEIYPDAEGYIPDRYMLKFNASDYTLMEDVVDGISVSGNSDGISVSGCDNAGITVYAVDGKVIRTAAAFNGEFRLNVEHGVYIVNVNGVNHKVVVK